MMVKMCKKLIICVDVSIECILGSQFHRMMLNRLTSLCESCTLSVCAFLESVHGMTFVHTFESTINQRFPLLLRGSIKWELCLLPCAGSCLKLWKVELN